VLPDALVRLTVAVGSPGSPAGWWFDLPNPQHDPDEVRRRADEILSRSEYQWDDGSSNPLDSLADWIAERLSKLGGSFGASGSLPTWVGWLVLVGLVALVALIVYRVRRNLRRNPTAAGPRGTVVVAEGEEQVDWAAEAERHEAGGRWREGLRCRYRALAGELADRGVIPDLVGRTAGEFVGDVAASAAAASAAFAAATDLFERAWYGGEATGPGERDRFVALAADVLANAHLDPDRRPSGERPLAVPT
jgi:Domain of unknown function (DUF4129)